MKITLDNNSEYRATIKLDDDEYENKLYGYMEDWYENFLKQKNISYSDLVKILEGKSLDIAAIIHDDSDIHFSIIDSSCHKEILVIGQSQISAIKRLQDNENLQEALISCAIAAVIFDQFLGDDENTNPARAKGFFWFDEEAKRLCRI